MHIQALILLEVPQLSWEIKHCERRIPLETYQFDGPDIWDHYFLIRRRFPEQPQQAESSLFPHNCSYSAIRLHCQHCQDSWQP